MAADVPPGARSVPVENRAGMPGSEFRDLAGQLSHHSTLGTALDWARAQSPPRPVASIVTQDEFTHDVVIGWERGYYLVYDTT